MHQAAVALRSFLLLSCLLLGSACGSSPTAPPPGLVTQCPANFTVDSGDGGPVPITYALPGATGGVPPLNVTCTPASGTTLPVGTHPIACTVTDSRGTTASCSFEVRVLGPLRLQATRFLAFGDSLTEGKDSPPLPTNLLVDMPGSYPWYLQRMLEARYVQQRIDVLNNGAGGEKAEDGPRRLPDSLEDYTPQVLLLMEGTNDIFGGNELGAQRALEGLGRMIQQARGAGVRVFLATIPPQRAGGARTAAALFIPGFNERIRELARSQNVTLVDVYDAMKDRMHLIGVDDLHPTLQGYEVIAQTFMEAIQGSLEAPRVVISRFR